MKQTKGKSDGLGMAQTNHFTHQKLQSIFTHNYILRTGDINILTETKLSDDRPRIAPDICIWENAHMYDDIDPENPLLTIEITHSKSNDRYSEKVILDAFRRYPSILESFIYNFDEQKWIRYTPTENGILKEEGKNYSKLLKCYLKTFLI